LGRYGTPPHTPAQETYPSVQEHPLHIGSIFIFVSKEAGYQSNPPDQKGKRLAPLPVAPGAK